MNKIIYEERPKGFEDDVLRRLAALEAHLINLIVPVQNMVQTIADSPNIKQIVRSLSGPVKLNDQRLIDTIQDFEKRLNRMLGDLAVQLGKMDDDGIVKLVSYIQSVMSQIDKSLNRIDQKPPTNVRVYVDDKEMIPGDDTKYKPKKKKGKR